MQRGTVVLRERRVENVRLWERGDLLNHPLFATREPLVILYYVRLRGLRHTGPNLWPVSQRAGST